MRCAGLALLVVFAGSAAAQQGSRPFDPVQIEFDAEKAAGIALLTAGERYLNEGIVGPDSKTCRFVADAIEHLARAAVAIGALPPGVNPDMLTGEQRRTFNEKVGIISERNAALKRKACGA